MDLSLVESPATGTASKAIRPLSEISSSLGSPNASSSANKSLIRAIPFWTSVDVISPSITISAGVISPKENFSSNTKNACLVSNSSGKEDTPAKPVLMLKNGTIAAINNPPVNRRLMTGRAITILTSLSQNPPATDGS